MNYRLYIGLNVQGGEEWEKSEAINIIISVCRSRGITALSLSDMQGIYTYDNGKTVFENTLVLLLVDFKGDIEGLVLSLKTALKQECIMIEKLVNSFDFI